MFGLDYRVAEPVASLLGDGPLRGYGRLFQLLWSLQAGLLSCMWLHVAMSGCVLLPPKGSRAQSLPCQSVD